jgi:membrane fusion protein (multidrug efflux system)
MSKKKWIGLTVIVVAALALALTAYLHWHHSQLYPSTENAYVHGDVITVASRIPGTLQEVLVDDNDWAQEGQVVARLDPRDFDQALSEAKADLAKAKAALELDHAQIAGAEAQLEVARSQAELARSDRARYTDLQQKGSIAQRQYEQATTSATVADAQVVAAEKALSALRAKLEVDRGEVGRMQARYDLAALRRSYCTITAPADGMVADKSAQPGQVVAAGQPLCRVAALAPDHVWVEANFKETQLHRMRPGQAATVTFDALPDREFRGKVEALSAGTGAVFALLPPQNATGNWVKIVQRLPVRVALNLTAGEVRDLRLGLTATVTVDTRSLDHSR